jgi:hypothetical protein
MCHGIPCTDSLGRTPAASNGLSIGVVGFQNSNQLVLPKVTILFFIFQQITRVTHKHGEQF